MGSVEPVKSENNGTQLNLLYASDRSYLPHMATSLMSACSNSGEVIDRCFVLSYDLEQEDVDRINSFLEPKTGKTLELLSLGIENVQDFFISNHISPAAYLRFFLAEQLPSSVDWTLYLDGDTLCRGSLDFFQNVAQIAEDGRDSVTLAWACRESSGEHLRQHGFRGVEYFNSGVMLINVEAWRREEIGPQLVATALRVGSKMSWWDQDILNLVLENRWAQIPPRFNSQSFNDHRSAVIAHFTGKTKPWHYGCNHPLRAEYRAYRALTNFLPFRREKFGTYARKFLTPGWWKKIKRRRIFRKVRVLLESILRS